MFPNYLKSVYIHASFPDQTSKFHYTHFEYISTFKANKSNKFYAKHQSPQMRTYLSKISIGNNIDYH